jgi:hypothetical protein
MSLEQAIEELDAMTAMRKWIDNYLSIQNLELLAIELSGELN